jgi:hypothetical protein
MAFFFFHRKKSAIGESARLSFPVFGHSHVYAPKRFDAQA